MDYNHRVAVEDSESATRTNEPGAFKMGSWLVEPSLNRVSSERGEARLEPRIMDILVLLAEHAGKVVSKNDLLDRVWPQEFVGESSLTHAIARLRRALGDDARTPRYIETIPKRGYRLVEEVEWLDSQTAESASSEAAGAPNGGRAETKEHARVGFPRARSVAILCLVAAIVGAALLWVAQSRKPPGGPPLDPSSTSEMALGTSADREPPTILVASFQNQTGDSSLDFVGLRVRETLSQDLVAAGLAPVSHGTEPQEHLPGDEAGHALVVSGSYFATGGELELTSRITEAGTGRLIYAPDAVRATTEGLTGAIHRLSQLVLGALATHLSSHAYFSLLSRPPLFDAYQEFITGSLVFDRDLSAAAAHLEKSIELDPRFVAARLRAARAHVALGNPQRGRELLDELESERQDLTVFEAAYLDAFLAWHEGRYAESVRSLEQVEEMTPDDLVLRYLIANQKLRLNRPHEALEIVQGLDPSTSGAALTRYRGSFMHAWVVTAEGRAYRRLGNSDGQLSTAEEGIAGFPERPAFHRLRVQALAAEGRLDELDAAIQDSETRTARVLLPAELLVEAAWELRARGDRERSRAYAERSLQWIASHRSRTGDGPGVLMTEAMAFCYAERWDDARTVLLQLTERSPDSVVFQAWLGSVAARLGDRQRAEAVAARLESLDDPYLYGAHLHHAAWIRTQLGDQELALALLRAAVPLGWSQWRQLDVLFLEPLWPLPQFQELARPQG